MMNNLGLKLDLEYMEFTKTQIPGHENLGDVIICRTGYTGEFGYELLPSWNCAQDLWEILVEAISKVDGRVCGLGARDTLRTEMGYPLHGHELSIEISPIQASANWAVALSKAKFRGKSSLERQKAEGAKTVLRALKSLDRGIPRGGMAVKSESGEVIGELTSGTFSPTLRVGIGLALLKPEFKVGTKVLIDVRGRNSEAEIVKLPFVESKVK